MEHLQDLAIILKTYPYQERDKIVVFLTENSGKLTGIAKGGINSKRFGGALDFLACSKIKFVQKPNSEMVRIEEAHIHYAFQNLHKNFDAVAAASLGIEFYLRLFEQGSAVRELFVILSQYLFMLDENKPVDITLNAFWVKFLKVLGYTPELFNCIKCNLPLAEILDGSLFWEPKNGGLICENCNSKEIKGLKPIRAELALLFHFYLSKPFKTVYENLSAFQKEDQQILFNFLRDFMFQHVPGVPNEGFRSLDLVKNIYK